MSAIDEEKERLRALFRQQRKSLSPEEKRRMDETIARRVEQLPAYREAETVFFYVSAPGEVDTRCLMEAAHRDGKTVAVPRCIPGSREMRFYCIDGEENLHPGAFGISEPDPSVCLPVSDGCAGLCLVPGLAFDRDGTRLGYGKGYYDRFLSRFSGVTVGLCYERFLRQSLPRDRYDRPVSLVVTEKE